MNYTEFLTEIGRAMERSRSEPISIADVIGVINKGFAEEMHRQEQDILRAASHGLETRVPDYTEE